MQVSVAPSSPHPGDVLLFQVAGAPPDVRVEWDGRPVAGFPSGSHWVALIGIDLDVRPGAVGWRVTRPSATKNGGALAAGAVTVRPRTFPTQKLTLPQAMVDLDPPRSRVSRASAAKSGRPWPTASASASGGAPSGTPSRAPEPTGGFGLRRIINGQPRSPHTGFDWAAPVGTPVLATNAGRAALVAEHFFAGRNVVLDHGLGLFTFYYHLDRDARRRGGAGRRRPGHRGRGRDRPRDGPAPPLRGAPRRRAGRPGGAPRADAAAGAPAPVVSGRAAPAASRRAQAASAPSDQTSASEATRSRRTSPRGTFTVTEGSSRLSARRSRAERAEPDEEGPDRRQAEPGLAPGHGEGVRAAVVEAGQRLVDQRVQERADAREHRGPEQVLGGQIEPCEVRAREVAAPEPEVARQVAEHVDELEPLAEARPERPHPRQVPSRAARPVGRRHVRPELAHAARVHVGVAIQVGARLEGADEEGHLWREVLEDLDHGLGEGEEDARGAGAVPRLERAVRRQDVGQAREQEPLRGRLVSRPGLGEDRGRGVRRPGGRLEARGAPRAARAGAARAYPRSCPPSARRDR